MLIGRDEKRSAVDALPSRERRVIIGIVVFALALWGAGCHQPILAGIAAPENAGRKAVCAGVLGVSGGSEKQQC
jgi:hypothetical protein